MVNCLNSGFINDFPDIIYPTKVLQIIGKAFRTKAKCIYPKCMYCVLYIAAGFEKQGRCVSFNALTTPEALCPMSMAN